MRRRAYLRTVGATGVAAGLAGCLGSALGGGNPNVALGEPENQRVDPEDLSYPAYGQRIPDVTLPAPLSGESVNLRDDVDRPFFLTFIFTHCMSVCPALTSALRQVQIQGVQNDYADEVAFYPITFDPERDTAARLRAFAEKLNVDLSVGNWQFLRPDGPARAKEVVDEQFGVVFQRNSEKQENYMFTHIGLVLLANADGYVERAYRGQNPDEQRMISDLRAVRRSD